jgi:hypothetical protein
MGGTTNAVYLRARWYQPGTGTLLGVNPALDSTGQAYSYAGGNPVAGEGPSGLGDLDVSWAFTHFRHHMLWARRMTASCARISRKTT